MRGLQTYELKETCTAHMQRELYLFCGWQNRLAKMIFGLLIYDLSLKGCRIEANIFFFKGFVSEPKKDRSGQPGQSSSRNFR